MDPVILHYSIQDEYDSPLQVTKYLSVQTTSSNYKVISGQYSTVAFPAIYSVYLDLWVSI